MERKTRARAHAGRSRESYRSESFMCRLGIFRFKHVFQSTSEFGIQVVNISPVTEIGMAWLCVCVVLTENAPSICCVSILLIKFRKSICKSISHGSFRPDYGGFLFPNSCGGSALRCSLALQLLFLLLFPLSKMVTSLS